MLRSRQAIERHHKYQTGKLVRYARANFAAYRDLPKQPFDHLPVIDKAALLANFQHMNRAGLRADQLREILASGQERWKNYIIGHSTGTSGNRGYYVISDAERFVWLGTILAKTLPNALWRRHRVALALPGFSSLYRSAVSGSRIKLGFFDLADGVDAWAQDFDRFAADTIVAPPKVLRILAERGLLRSTRIFSGAEVLDPLDRSIIEAATGRIVREIYMATEGLFGVSCPHGTLHLVEDVVKFEWERPAPGSSLQAPIVTDFTRRSQALIRYRMNDLLELHTRPCPCGSPFQAVRQIVGRADDILYLPTKDGGETPITPDVLRNAVVDTDPRIQDFRVLQTGLNALEISLADNIPTGVDDHVRRQLVKRLEPFGVEPQVTVSRGITVSFDHKLRRVRGLAR